MAARSLRNSWRRSASLEQRRGPTRPGTSMSSSVTRDKAASATYHHGRYWRVRNPVVAYTVKGAP